MSRAAAKKTTTVIRRCGQTVFVSPVRDEAVRALSTLIPTIAEDAPRGYHIAGQGFRFYRLNEPASAAPSLSVPHGLAPVVREILGRCGHAIQASVDPGPAALPTICSTNLARLENVDWAWLNFVQQHDAGIVRINSRHVQPARLLAQLARAWPDKKIVAVVTIRRILGGSSGSCTGSAAWRRRCPRSTLGPRSRASS